MQIGFPQGIDLIAGVTMFLSDPTHIDLLFTALSCVGLLSMGLLSLFLLPWTDEEIEQVDRSGRLLAARLQERLLFLDPENTDPGRGQVTSPVR